ncbi:MAG: bifunctional [glutamate--ammonia ligase]-adenylyl-L-tyrosine phosphorylase/[glutamate--ammonia-ligase] adenylyltransferase [Gammaproteobacteria bacterium]
MTSGTVSPDARPTPIQEVPEALREEVTDRWTMFRQVAARTKIPPPHHPDFLRALFRVWASSDFVAHGCISHPKVLADLRESGDLLSDYGPGEVAEKVRQAVRQVQNFDDLSTVLRDLRRREMIRIAWRDLAAWADLKEVLSDLSDLADACVQAALAILYKWQCKARGTPRKVDGSAQQMIVLAMGKLGACELNFSSDIDLIFSYPEPGFIRGRHSISHEEFFTELGQQLIHALADTTAAGFVFRVDMRLRPYGDSGPLVMSFEAMEEYYQSQGREWERYAMIKARPLTGDPGDADRLMKLLQPFVFRRYLDFGAVEALRELKQQMVNEVERRGLHNDIKLGPGGIREVEFIAQSFQLIRGGREPKLRERSVLKVLDHLATLHNLPAYATKRLADAYCFLRRVENRLQAFADRQTHRLPREQLSCLRLAFAMGFQDWRSFHRELESHRAIVREQFEQVFAAPQIEAKSAQDPTARELTALWGGLATTEDGERILRDQGFDGPERTVALLERFREGYVCRSLESRGRARLDRLMPLLLAATANAARPSVTLARIVQVLESIAGRSAYLALLTEHPLALSQLVQLCSSSAWIADLLAQHPVLLDDLIDPRTLYEPLRAVDFQRQLKHRLTAIEEDDLEQQMEVLRQEKQSAVLRTAAAEITDRISTLKAGRQLTEVAESLLEQTLALAFGHLRDRHGDPRCGIGRNRRDAGFAIVAYGKFGSMELGYGADLDLVFLHDSSGRSQKTNGRKSIDNAVFFARLGQRVIHLINTHTPAGVLYEMDMRLRPSGASGLLVSSLDGFEEYQQEEAWTWEHQALVRARVVAGDDTIAQRFNEVRRNVLRRRRDPEELRAQVLDMRERMRDELSAGETGSFDLKQDRGGVADIEFMVQYGVLLWSHDHLDLACRTDTVGLLEGFAAAGVMDQRQAHQLSEVYQDYLARLHRLAIEERSAVVPEHEFRESREMVTRIWCRLIDKEGSANDNG